MSSPITLADLSDAVAEVLGFCGPQEIAERLRELGVYQGARVEVVGQAPFMGPRLYRIGMTVLALRQEEAACVSVQPTGMK